LLAFGGKPFSFPVVFLLGKTKAQFRDKVGSLLLPSEASSYRRGCYQSSPWKDREVLFITQSAWIQQTTCLPQALKYDSRNDGGLAGAIASKYEPRKEPRRRLTALS
jgi:hypothetical protein